MGDIMEQDGRLKYAVGAPERIALHQQLARVVAKKRTKKAQIRGAAAGSEEPRVTPSGQLPR
jgi:hypothetical protein